MADADALRALLERVEAATGPLDPETACRVDALGEGEWISYLGESCGDGGATEHKYEVVSRPGDYSSVVYVLDRDLPDRSLDAAVALVERVLPGFYQSSGLCALSGHASIGPDYNGPEGNRLRAEWPEQRFHDGFHADLSPGDGRHRQCFALIHCALQALLARAGRPNP